MVVEVRRAAHAARRVGHEASVGEVFQGAGDEPAGADNPGFQFISRCKRAKILVTMTRGVEIASATVPGTKRGVRVSMSVF